MEDVDDGTEELQALEEPETCETLFEG